MDGESTIPPAKFAAAMAIADDESGRPSVDRRDVALYNAQTERLKALDAFVTPFGPRSDGPLVNGCEAVGCEAANQARELAVQSAFEAIRRIADHS